MNVMANENLPLELWIDLKKRELESVNNSLNTEIKIRKRSEFLLILFCVIAFIYIYPVQEIDSNLIIEIPAISLKIPLQIALIGFPTLITSIYLIFMNSAIRQSRLKIISIKINVALKKITKFSPIAIDQEKTNTSKVSLSLFLLPSPIQMPTYSENYFTKVGNFIVKWFVGLVFNLFPFVTTFIITLKANNFLNNKIILVWDIVCILIMLITFLSTFFNFYLSENYESYESAV